MNAGTIFFDFMARRGLSAEALRSTLVTWNLKQLLDFVAEFHEYLPSVEYDPTDHGIFRFTANHELSGYPFPCANIACRLKHVDRMARIAALYADRMVIVSPMASLHALQHATTAIDESYVRLHIEASLQIAYYLRPLIESGVVVFSHQDIAVCTECFKGVRRLLDTTNKHVSSVISSRIAKNKGFYQDFPDGRHYIVQIPPELLGEPVVIISKLSDKSGEPIRPRKSTIVRNITWPLVIDLVKQDLMTRSYQVNCLVNRDIYLDIALERSRDSVEKYRQNKALMDGFRHSLPFVEVVPLDTLISIRDSEEDSFNLYRSSLSKALHSASALDEKQVRECFSDEVMPEVSKVQLAVKSAGKSLTRSLAFDALAVAGFVTVGHFSGVLTTDAGAVLTALGGYKLFTEIKAQFEQRARDVSTAEQARYYFLWRVQQEAAGYQL